MLDLHKILPQRQHESFLIPFGVTIMGDLLAEISGRVDGKIEGNVIITGKLIVGEKAVINGNVSADQVISYGIINGDVQTAGKAIIHNNAFVGGDVLASIIDIDQTAVIEGSISKTRNNGITTNAQKVLLANKDVLPTQAAQDNNNLLAEPTGNVSFFPKKLQLKKKPVIVDKESWF